MKQQVNASVCTGMGRVGKRRLKLYRAVARAKGYPSFSAYVIQLLERETNSTLNKTNGNKSLLRVTANIER